jgi:redox-sensing transcriptional repressor
MPAIALMRYHKVPDETIQRLPIYLRGLMASSEQGHKSLSSKDLAEVLGVTPWQIRKDFSYFGDFGTRGVGYNIENLAKEIKKILRLNVAHRVALVGVGNLGSAVLAYPGFRTYGLEITAAFDSDAEKIGKKIDGLVIEDASNIRSLKERNTDLAIITVPREAAQATADALVEAGVRGILKFSPCYITVPRKVKVITIDIAMDLARLPYYMPAS